ncbi:MAG: hypothetical protein KDD02_13635, partial [Phaeodactylibacter sp.]|nr:hypothetical protein [Phaeodactylibacter sp.]
SFQHLYEENKDVVAGGNPWLYNPLLYLCAIVAGTSLPILLVAIWGKIRVIREGRTGPLAWIFLAFIVLEFLALWSLDATFVRRANIFLPFIAVLGAYGLMGIPKGWPRRLAIAAVWFYTLAIALDGQSGAWWDTRYAARDYLLENFDGRRIEYSPYAMAMGVPKGVPLGERGDILVAHEAYYSRYWKSLTTPFTVPKCCEEVYHCISTEDCQLYQALLSGQAPKYREVQRFETHAWLPERRLYKHWFGTYETFQGDVIIFEKDKQ